jgi:hypothetical protein
MLSSLVYLLIFVAIWVILNAWLFPKMGIRT